MKLLTTSLGFVRFLAEKYRKQSRQRQFREQQIRDLRHEMGALTVLASEMQRQAGRGRILPSSVQELTNHVRRANRISREMGITVEDPDFRLPDISESSIAGLGENRPAQLVLQTLLDEISWYSNYVGSHLT